MKQASLFLLSLFASPSSSSFSIHVRSFSSRPCGQNSCVREGLRADWHRPATSARWCTRIISPNSLARLRTCRRNASWQYVRTRSGSAFALAHVMREWEATTTARSFARPRWETSCQTVRHLPCPSSLIVWSRPVSRGVFRRCRLSLSPLRPLRLRRRWKTRYCDRFLYAGAGLCKCCVFLSSLIYHPALIIIISALVRGNIVCDTQDGWPFRQWRHSSVLYIQDTLIMYMYTENRLCA